jgi:hypothetical protein
MIRRFPAIALTSAAFALAALMGLIGVGAARARPWRPGPGGRHRDSVLSHPLKTIAVLDMLTPSFEDERVFKMQDMVEEALTAKGDFTMMYPNDLKAAVEKTGAAEAYTTLVRVWQQRRVIDTPAMEKVAETVGIDAVVGIEVTHWEQYQIDMTSEGNSTTTVGLKISMYSAREKLLLWQASMIYVAKSPPYNPSNAVVETGGEARAAGKSVAPKPPEYVPTAQRVVKEVSPPGRKRARAARRTAKKGTQPSDARNSLERGAPRGEHERWMDEALFEAERAALAGECRWARSCAGRA